MAGKQDGTDAFMRSLASGLDDILNPEPPKTTAFVLLVAPFGQPDGEHRCNYISNAMRPDIIEWLRELLARWEASPIQMVSPEHEGKP